VGTSGRADGGEAPVEISCCLPRTQRCPEALVRSVALVIKVEKVLDTKLPFEPSPPHD
jgi:hypothetical protein